MDTALFTFDILKDFYDINTCSNGKIANKQVKNQVTLFLKYEATQSV